MPTIPLPDGRQALCDPEDHERLSAHAWVLRAYGNVSYVVRSARGKVVFMHREVMPGAARVRHVNGRGLDNRKENLEVVGQRGRARFHGQFAAKKKRASLEVPVGAPCEIEVWGRWEEAEYTGEGTYWCPSVRKHLFIESNRVRAAQSLPAAP